MIPVIIAAVVLLIDQLTKAWVLRTWPEPYTGEIPIIPGWLALTYVQNTGVAFGLFTGFPQFFTITSIIIIIFAIHFYLKHAPENQPWLAVSLGLILGGALGNVTDRIRFGYVVDFIKTFDGRFPVFNVADSAVVVGVLLMALTLMYLDQQEPARRLSPQVEAEDGR
jgi:signal peptidase II